MNTLIQYIFIGVVFLVAVGYIAKMIKDAMGGKGSSCSSGCGKCSSGDIFEKKESH